MANNTNIVAGSRQIFKKIFFLMRLRLRFKKFPAATRRNPTFHFPPLQPGYPVLPSPNLPGIR